MSWNELLDRPALELAGLVRERKLSSEELTRLYLSRIEALNPSLRAFVSVWPDAALREARRKDQQVRSGSPLPRFHGVPIAIKDLNMVRGRWTGMGSRAIRFPAPKDCRTTASLRRGGFVLLGKTTTSELGAMPVTEPDAHPPTRNPWDPAVTSGGSSGGAAAAVAAGMLPVAHASDGGGSVRIPASLCGLFGLKPSRGRVPNAYGLEDSHILYTCGPITRSVADAAAMLDVMAGLDVGRPHWLAPPSGLFADLVLAAPGPLKIRFTARSPLVDVHPSMQEAVAKAARTLESLGHRLEEAPAPDGRVEEFMPVWQAQVADTPVFFPWRLQPVTAWLRTAGRRLAPGQALEVQERMAGRVLAVLGDADLWLTPTVAVPTPPVHAFKELAPEQAFLKAAELGLFTAPCNLTGQPAANVPMGLRDGRWPIGIQLAGRVGDEATVLRVARQLEEAHPWRQLWPALARS